MAKRLLLSAVLGGLVAFGWGAVSWMALSWHTPTLLRFTDEVAVAKTVQANAPRAGVYLLLPYHWDHPARAKTEIPKGLLFFGAVRYQSPGMLGYNLRGLGIQMLGALVLSWLLLTLPAMGYWARVRVCSLSGLAAGILGRLPDWNWWGFSTDFTLLAILDLVIAWSLAGLVIASIVERRERRR